MATQPKLSLTWAQALRWRLRRQFVDPPGVCDAVGIAGRLCGVQAQVPAAAELALAVRSAAGRGSASEVSTALSDGRLVRTWSVRGTLHLLPIRVAEQQLSLLADARTWQKGSWQRTFAPLSVMAALAEQVEHALDGGPLTREELVLAIGSGMDHENIPARLRSGWSALLKPLAWQGVLCQGPPRGRYITFARPDRLLPDWGGLPDPEEAGPAVVRDYLAAYGPATIEALDAWLLRGATPKAKLRRWFAALEDEISPVDVEGRPAVVLSADVDELAATRPSPRAVHLLPAFDQYLLGPGTSDTAIVPGADRPLVSRAGGWISPVVLMGGRIAGTWDMVEGLPTVTPFPGADLPTRGLAAAIARISTLTPSPAHV